MKILINNKEICETDCRKYEDIVQHIKDTTSLESKEYFLLQNGKRFSDGLATCDTLQCCLRTCGGKGGFGSMLRAIGAQIEKTTNREACRDLSGRRLRDINEEKRLKAWLDKQAEREKEAEEKKKRKIAKLLAVPKHDFKDKEYEESRSKLTEKVNDAVEEGFKRAQEVQKASSNDNPEPSTSKRKASEISKAKPVVKPKKKKSALWIGDDISDCETDSSESEDEGIKPKNKAIAKA